MDTYWTWLLIRELQIKTTMKYHLTPVRMTIVKKLQTVNEGQDVKGTLLHGWWDVSWSLWRTVWRFFNKLGIKLPRESQVLVAQLCPALCDHSFVSLSVAPWTVAHKPPLSKEFYRKEYWSGQPFPSLGDLPELRTEPRSLASPALEGGFFTDVPPGKPPNYHMTQQSHYWSYTLAYDHIPSHSVTSNSLLPIDCSMPGSSVHHQLPEFIETHVHWVGNAIQPSHPLLSPFPLTFNLSQHQGLFQWVSSLHQVAKVLDFSASASVIPMNIQGWFPLGWTGWISLQSKGLSRVFSNTTVEMLAQRVYVIVHLKDNAQRIIVEII